jgi:hypothetical protein
MRRLPQSFDATVNAFRDMTALSAESAATRARVLARAEREARRRSLLRRMAMPLAIALAILFSGAALTAAGVHWRAPVAAQIGPADDPPPRGIGRMERPTRIVPALPDESAPASLPAVQEVGERLAYERAHRAHFFANAPARALAAWDEYLAAHPRGTFAPEARYNRALCLVRLGKLAAAVEALHPFAAGHRAGYRRHEACLLLRWLAEPGAPIDASCAVGN